MKMLLLFLALAAGAQEQSERVSSTPEARRTMAAFGRCVVERSPLVAIRTLQRDFTTEDYRARLRRLVLDNRSCLRRGGSMSSGGVLFAGALAESLLARDGTPLNVRLARAAMQPATPARSPSDRIAICLVRSVPDDVAALFATRVTSEEEAAAILALAVPVRLCTGEEAELEANDAGLRAILATAAFRTIHGAEPNSEARN